MLVLVVVVLFFFQAKGEKTVNLNRFCLNSEYCLNVFAHSQKCLKVFFFFFCMFQSSLFTVQKVKKEPFNYTTPGTNELHGSSETKSLVLKVLSTWHCSSSSNEQRSQLTVTWMTECELSHGVIVSSCLQFLEHLSTGQTLLNWWIDHYTSQQKVA